MCSVTFLPYGDTVFITSNRDEQHIRSHAVLPEIYHYPNGKLLFPKDGQAGGTWIAAHENGNAMVLLNGAEKKHLPEPPYRKSRGLIFLEIFSSGDIIQSFENILLNDIEPFTLVIWQQQCLWQASWDGKCKKVRSLPADTPYMWSSVTLYDEQIREKRKSWFEDWHEKTSVVSVQDIMRFHESAGDGDGRNDLKMSRDGLLLTVSITAMEFSAGKIGFYYKDLQRGLTSIHSLKPMQRSNPFKNYV